MKVALFADIHGNFPALHAVWHHARRFGAEDFWNLGDSVGYGPFAPEVLKFLRSRYVLTLRGNYDSKVLRLPERGEAWLATKRPEKALAFQACWESLSEEELRYLQELPEVLRLRYHGRAFFLCHGSPDSPGEHLDTSTSQERLEELGKATGADCVLCGHSHIPFDRTVGEWRFVNPGSVGRPDDGDPRASYCLLEVSKEGITTAFHRVGYDVDKVLLGLRSQGLPDVFGRMFLQGRSLESVLGGSVGTDATAMRRAILEVLEEYADVGDHAEQVASLALALFDWLRSLHGYSREERDLLEYAALLHDIGWCEGRQGHHKSSRKLIMQIQDLPFSSRQRRIVACVARYHRRSHPSEDHPVYRDLAPEDKKLVCALGGILRIADGLDCSHLGLVEELSCAVDSESVVITCLGAQPPQGEDEAAEKKKDLFEKHFNREVKIAWMLQK
jgi:putative phosphoesterase